MVSNWRYGCRAVWRVYVVKIAAERRRKSQRVSEQCYCVSTCWLFYFIVNRPGEFAHISLFVLVCAVYARNSNFHTTDSFCLYMVTITMHIVSVCTLILHLYLNDKNTLINVHNVILAHVWVTELLNRFLGFLYFMFLWWIAKISHLVFTNIGLNVFMD